MQYPNKYESIISTLCENLDTLDEPEARASMIWIIGKCKTITLQRNMVEVQ